MRNLSKRKLLVLTTIILLFLCVTSWWLSDQLLPTTPVYSNANLINGSDKYSELGLLNLSQFQISTHATEDPYQEVLIWFLDNDWKILIANHENWYRLTKEETNDYFFPKIRLFYSIDIQPTENEQTCITQYAYTSVVLFDGKVIHRSQDYLEVGSDYYHHQPECSISEDP